MAKGGKLTKILKKMQSIGIHNSHNHHRATSAVAAASSADLHPVYVGKSRRLYLVSSGVIHHPLFRELVERSASSGANEIAVGCEVVLFEHMLWMLENADPHPDSLDDLVDFYAC